MRSAIWHPYTQMFTAPSPLEAYKGEGAYLFTKSGKKILDAISSWWVTVHGHADPHIARAIAEQARQLEQVIFAGFTHPQAERLANRLVGHLPSGIEKVFFSDDGSTAVEVALKMAWQYWQNLAAPRSKLLALENAYHGDTFGAMSVSGRSIFTKAFDPLLFEVDFLPTPTSDTLPELLEWLDSYPLEEVAAIIVEPLVLGAGGMLMYPPAVLDALVSRCRSEGVLVIFDEVMTGFYRTGKLFASRYCEQKPDIMCLSKGLSGGFLPLSITACTAEIYNAFLSQDRLKTLFHGHSFTANPIACAAANASLDLFEAVDFEDRIQELVETQSKGLLVFEEFAHVSGLRHFGTILAMEVEGKEGKDYLAPVGKRLYEAFLERGILLRPLGNTLYVMPPYCIRPEELIWLHKQMAEVLERL